MLVHLLTGNAFAGMVGQGMGDLMGHHGRQLVIILSYREQAGEHGHLATRQAESIDLIAPEQVVLPLVPVAFDTQIDLTLQGLDFRCPGDAPTYFADALDILPGPHYLGLGQDLLVCLVAK